MTASMAARPLGKSWSTSARAAACISGVHCGTSATPAYVGSTAAECCCDGAEGGLEALGARVQPSSIATVAHPATDRSGFKSTLRLASAGPARTSCITIARSWWLVQWSGRVERTKVPPGLDQRSVTVLFEAAPPPGNARDRQRARIAGRPADQSGGRRTRARAHTHCVPAFCSARI
jgi:hypothetical protein